MQLRRIEVSAFRCFNDRVVIDEIGNGVTLIVGDNEAGKSTILAALQTVLFEKHNVTGAVANAMLPYGSKVRPEITLEFDHDGARYRLHKAFHQRPAAELDADSGGRWTGDAAEERLREMLEFTPPGKGGSKPEHRGLQALFWVEQGSSHAQPHVTETAQTSLAGALEAEVGTVTGGERGRYLIKSIEDRMLKFFTPKTRKPAGPFKEAIDRAEEARDCRDELAARLKDFEDKVEALARERDRLAKLKADDPLGAADNRVKEAQAAIRSVESLEARLETAKANRKTAESQHELARSRLKRRQEDREAAEKAEEEVARLKQKEQSAQDAVNAAQKALDGAQNAHGGAKEAFEAAEREAGDAHRLADLLRKSEELKVAQTRLQKAKAADEAAKNLKARANASPFTPEVLEELRRLDRDAHQARARLEAVATRIEFDPEEGRRVFIDDAPVETGALTLTESTRIELEGFGRIQVTPGGEDLSSRREAAEAAVEDLKRALDEHGVTDLEDAERQATERQTWLKDAEIHRNAVESQAPEGLDALSENVAGLDAQVARLSEDIEEDEVPELSTDEAAAHADELALNLKDAQTSERKASDQVKDEQNQLKTAKTNSTTAAVQREAAVNTARSLGKKLDQAAEGESDDALENAFKEAAKALTDEANTVADIQKGLEESDPKGARSELESATDARDKVGKNLQSFRDRIQRLEVELRTLGQDDMMAELEIAVGECERAEAQETRLCHEAKALTLLLDNLAEAEQAARETFLGPVRDRVEPYLKRLFPGSELVLDDQSLAITHLRRDGKDEPYDRLSVGTREQLAVLTRLAFADLLGEHGKQSPIILDDALVFSDDGRLEEMQRILDRAADRQQIIVLTCHERAYFERGWATIRLEKCKG
ncbi:MAG: AAA family ATPase [Proteobacteria bacterium]|nr:AAA family ATPase [Pseudomonadota bacterium]